MNENIKRTLDLLLYEKLLPDTCLFDITEFHIKKYIEYYSNIHGKGNKKYDESYARKLAGLNLLKYKISLGASYKNSKEGLIYVIENSAFDGYQKIGMTIDLVQRLKSYQTYDPLKRYRITHYDFVLNRKHTEEKILNSFNVDIESGEWIKKTDALNLIKSFRS